MVVAKLPPTTGRAIGNFETAAILPWLRWGRRFPNGHTALWKRWKNRSVARTRGINLRVTFPAILSVKRHGVFPELGDRRFCNVVVIDGAQREETGIGKSDGGASVGSRIQVKWSAVSAPLKTKLPVVLMGWNWGILQWPLRTAEFEGVVVFDPGNVGVEVGLLLSACSGGPPMPVISPCAA